MKGNALYNSAVGLVVASTLLLGAVPVFAQTPSTSGTKTAANLSTIITKANADIATRITALNDLQTRVQSMKNVSASEVAAISAQVQTNISGLQALQTRIDADTTAASARADARTIFTTFRIYALVIPQGHILAAADRVTVVNGLINTIVTKLQARITADQTAGKDVTALTAALTDINAKVADANTQATSAQSGVSGLLPDQGNQSVITSNKAALLAARANIKTATQDLQAARADIKTIMQGLKTLGK